MRVIEQLFNITKCFVVVINQITDEDLKGGRAERDFFAYHASTARSPVFINSREVTGRFLLDPGSYIIIPTTFEPNHTGEFLVRIFSEKPVTTGQDILIYFCCCTVFTHVHWLISGI